MKTIKHRPTVKDTLFKAPEPSDQHLKLPPSALHSAKREKSFIFCFRSMFWALLAMETFWIIWNVFLFVSNKAQFFKN